MSKLNKVFLALVIALLITAVAETLFIFVYKPPQQIPSTAVVSEVRKIPQPKQISDEYLKLLADWPFFRNATLSLVETINGSISAMTKPTAKDPMFTLRLYGEKSIDTTKFVFPLKDYNKINFFLQDLKTGSQTKISVDDLKIGDQITIILNSDIGKTMETSFLTSNIYKIKK